MKKVAFLGLGAMGTRMVQRLVEAGHAVTVWNRTPARAAELSVPVALTPRQAAAGADVVISMVTDDEASRAVWLDPHTGAVAGLSAGALAVEASTLTVDWVRQLAAEVGAAGVELVDAPVVGTRPHAEAGQLVVLAGGSAQSIEALTPVLEAYAAKVVRLGPSGAGAAAKLAVNFLFALQVAAFSEAVAGMVGAGIPEDQASRFLAGTAVASPAVARVATLIDERSFAPNFPVSLVVKDLGYAAGLGAGPLAEVARAVYAQAVESGYGDDDISGVSRLFLGD